VSTQVNFHLQLHSVQSVEKITVELEAALRNALRKAIFDTLDDNGLEFVLTIRGPEVVSSIF
jgi:hypothetical protein